MNLRDQNPRRNSASRPWQTRTEFLVDQALAAWDIDEDELRTMVPAARPQDPFPERTGFQKMDWTIDAVLNIDRQTPSYRSWISGMPAQRSYLTEDGSQASSRYSMGALWQ